MTGDPIPDSDSVARHCPFGTLDPETSMPTARAFTIRSDIGEESLSVNWLEYLAPNNPTAGLDALRESPPRRFGGQSKLAVLNVGDSKQLIADDLGITLSVVHDPHPNNESHAQIGNIRSEPMAYGSVGASGIAYTG